MSNASSSLFLCRTALQARICLRIIETEGIAKPDVFFFTQSDSDTERQYFARLAALGGKSQYLFIKNQRIDLMSHVLGYLRTDSQFTRRNAYGRIFLASINNLIFRAIIKFNPAARVATFDDGTSNIFPFSLYHRETDYGRSKGGRRGASAPRWIPASPEVRQALAQAAGVLPKGSRNLLDGQERYVEFINRHIRPARELLHAHGIKGFHELRAAYACERFQQITGHPAPVNGGQLHRLDRDRDRQAREVISKELGHNRVEVVAAYIGARR